MIDPIALAARLARMAPTGDVAEPVEYLEKLGNTMRDAAVTIRQLYDRVREYEQKLAACRPSDEAVAVAMLAVKLWTEADQYIRSRMMPKTMKRLADEIIRLAVEGTK